MQSRNQYLKELRTEYLKTKSKKKRGELLNEAEKRTKLERKYLKLPQNLISHHLKVLKDSNLITLRKEGLKVFYKINKNSIKKYLKILNKFLAKDIFIMI